MELIIGDLYELSYLGKNLKVTHEILVVQKSKESRELILVSAWSNQGEFSYDLERSSNKGSLKRIGNSINLIEVPITIG